MRAKFSLDRFLLLGVALCLLLTASIAAHVFPFKVVTRFFLRVPSVFRSLQVSHSKAELHDLVRSAAWRFPTLNRCLPKALALCGLMKLFGYQPTLRLGIDKRASTEGGFLAHAWVEDEDFRRFDEQGVQIEDFAPLSGAEESKIRGKDFI